MDRPRDDEAPYVKGHWYDPYNRNKFKGDSPLIFGQSTFLNISLVSDTAVAGRKLPVPSGVGSVDPDSGEFFGRMGHTRFQPELFVLGDALSRRCSPSVPPIGGSRLRRKSTLIT